jgi:hypothetical protein
MLSVIVYFVLGICSVFFISKYFLGVMLCTLSCCTSCLLDCMECIFLPVYLKCVLQWTTFAPGLVLSLLGVNFELDFHGFSQSF